MFSAAVCCLANLLKGAIKETAAIVWTKLGKGK